MGCVDYSPSYYKVKLIVELYKFIGEISENIDCLLLVGDKNIDLLKQDSLTEKQHESFQNSGCGKNHS